MRTRVLSSFAVVFLGLMPIIVGGPVFALAILILGLAGLREYLDLAARIGPADVAIPTGAGALMVTAFALAAYLGKSTAVLFAAFALTCALPLAAMLVTNSGSPLSWLLLALGGVYLGMPIFAAIMLRSTAGDVGANSLADLTARYSLGWPSYPRGLAWTLVVVVSTWVGDSVAYLAGRGIGGRKLAPRISPNKTMAGSVAGLIGSAIVGLLAFGAFELGNPVLGIMTGTALGAAGQMGDLAESYLKRLAGVKDSGSLIPGHGGILDRIDALLFAFPVGFLIASGLEWWQL